MKTKRFSLEVCEGRVSGQCCICLFNRNVCQLPLIFKYPDTGQVESELFINFPIARFLK